jgi:hypothetical protein
MENFEYKELVEKYLDGEMDIQEKLQFEEELKTNSELISELEFYNLAHLAIIGNKLSAVQSSLKTARQEFDAAEKKRKIYKISSYTIGAILGLSVLGYVLSTETKKEDKKPSIPSDTTKSVKLENKVAELIEKPALSNDVEPKSTKAPKEKSVSFAQNDQKTSKEVISEIHKEEISTVIKDTVAKVKEKTKLAPVQKQQISDPCHDKQITFSYLTKETCFGKTSGEITISKCEGGAIPYNYVLSNGEQNKSGMFSQLEAGDYTIQVKDKNGCESQAKSVKIQAEHCKVDLYLDPSTNSPVVFQAYQVSGTLSIYDKGGNLKFKSTKAANSDFEWNGESENTKLAPGYYLFMIKYEDGTVQNGSVTILP